MPEEKLMLVIRFRIHNGSTANKQSDVTFYKCRQGNNHAVSTKPFIVGVILDTRSLEMQEAVRKYLNLL
jgi:hypothetical protein